MHAEKKGALGRLTNLLASLLAGNGLCSRGALWHLHWLCLRWGRWGLPCHLYKRRTQEHAASLIAALHDDGDGACGMLCRFHLADGLMSRWIKRLPGLCS